MDKDNFDLTKVSISRLQSEDIQNFDCGDNDLNDFLKHDALDYQKTLLAVTYVLKYGPEKVIMAYYSLANDRISIGDFESNTQFNRFRRNRFVNRKRIKSYPAVKICRLGVSKDFRGLNIGSSIIDYLITSFTNGNKTGCRFITVDAYIVAIPFYLKNGFLRLNENEKEPHTRLLYLDLADFTDTVDLTKP
ncbi:MAG: GNAT family N-acetyltransferase [Bacteroidales bacterium]|nr:GNAT family N-acetyltransferase [Bacteroidales bacterium]